MRPDRGLWPVSTALRRSEVSARYVRRFRQGLDCHAPPNSASACDSEEIDRGDPKTDLIVCRRRATFSAILMMVSANGSHQRHRGPVTRRGGNELIGPVRKVAVKVWLKGRRSRSYIP